MSALVYDCFLFFNELDLLEIRLNVLSEAVDKFVLVEADRTFANKEKPFYFEENKEKYKQFLGKIIHIKISEYPETKDAWDMEYYQRNQIARCFTQCSSDDVILISDLDEIPNPEIINNYKETGSGICKLKQLHFDYYLNYQRCGENKYWYPAKIARYKEIITNNYTPQEIRMERKIKTIKNAGWHFSFLDGVEKIKYKIQSFAHQEWNNENYINDKIEYKIRMGLDLFDRKNRRLIPVKITNKKYPQYIVNNKEKYAHLIFPYINQFIVIKNTLYCLPYSLKEIIKQIAKTILPRSIVLKIKKQNVK
jgi:beta-1,4-mannosyl-glycoprotein beta-1,4-N-acetylglucosaminyltransferase